MSTREGDNNIVKIIDAASKRKQSENQFRAEVLKYAIQSKIDRQAKIEQQQNEYALKQQQTQINNPQQYTPEQAYLKRRFMEENPLAQLTVPEAQNVPQGVTPGVNYPQDEIVRDPKTQTYRQQPLTADRQAELLITRVDQMIAQGRQPHPAILKIADAARQRLIASAENRAAGIKSGANNKYSGADAKLVSQSESLTSKLIQLKGMVGTDAENYLPFGGGTSKGQEFQTLRDDVKSTLLYLRSGAAVTPQEYKRLEALLPKLTRFKEVDQKQLDRFISEFSAIGERIKQGRKYDVNTGSFTGGNNNLSVDDNSQGAEPNWDSTPEGSTATDPDGNNWVKRDGEWFQEQQ